MIKKQEQQSVLDICLVIIRTIKTKREIWSFKYFISDL